MDYFIENNSWDPQTGYLLEVQRLIQTWLSTGKVPIELERLINIYWQAHITAKP